MRDHVLVPAEKLKYKMAAACRGPIGANRGLIGPKGMHKKPTKTYKFIGSGAMDVTKPYKFKGFGAMEVTKPYKFIGFGAAACQYGPVRICFVGDP